MRMLFSLGDRRRGAATRLDAESPAKAVVK
jgi:hypothetical protein